ncbi:MAG TPA: fumarylacetoacetate hydrolase family protein [candidate division Zixibacteria bacterium]|nr:fumarylacetoacetate hydrolase family protein [candidate division Zixibacteria bacterium]
MRLVTFLPKNSEPHIGLAVGEWNKWEYILDLNQAAQKEGITNFPAEMVRFIEICGEFQGEIWNFANQIYSDAKSYIKKNQSQTQLIYKPAEVKLLAPLQPRLLRDFIAFRGHIKRTRANRGMQVAKEWDFLPAYYNGNNLTVIGPEEEVEYGQYLLAQEGQIKKFQTEKLDYEAEIGYVIGKAGKNISRTEAKNHLFGVTIFNDVSIRDLQLLVMNVGLGPGFGKDWANVLGPCIVTADEFGEPGSNRVTVKVNGQERLNNTYQGLVNSPILEPGEKTHWSFEEIVEFVSYNQKIYPGEVWGSGTISGGCELEQGQNARYLKPGDVVEIAIEGIGVLRNKIV